MKARDRNETETETFSRHYLQALNVFRGYNTSALICSFNKLKQYL